MRDIVRREITGLWENQSWMLHHNNAPAHASLLVTNYLTKHCTTVVPHALYSPDLAPPDFYLFPKMKSTLKGHNFQTIDEIQENATLELRNIKENKFQWVLQKLKK